jgi:hypothetical protein
LCSAGEALPPDIEQALQALERQRTATPPDRAAYEDVEKAYEEYQVLLEMAEDHLAAAKAAAAAVAGDSANGATDACFMSGLPTALRDIDAELDGVTTNALAAAAASAQSGHESVYPPGHEPAAAAGGVQPLEAGAATAAGDAGAAEAGEAARKLLDGAGVTGSAASSGGGEVGSGGQTSGSTPPPQDLDTTRPQLPQEVAVLDPEAVKEKLLEAAAALPERADVIVTDLLDHRWACRTGRLVPFLTSINRTPERADAVVTDPLDHRRALLRRGLRSRGASLKPAGHSMPCRACREGHLLLIWQPCIGSLF